MPRSLLCQTLAFTALIGICPVVAIAQSYTFPVPVEFARRVDVSSAAFPWVFMGAGTQWVARSAQTAGCAGTYPNGAPARVPGQYADDETGLHYNYFRDYDPSTGRYVESDPIGLRGGINTYLYSGNDPIVKIDPLGLAFFAKRPLQGMPWFGRASSATNSVDDRNNTEISHEHIFFEDGKAPSNIGFGPDGLFSEPSSKGYRVIDKGYNDCVMRLAVRTAPLGQYCLLGINGIKNNCQDWADRVRTIYARFLSESWVREQCEFC